MLDCVVVNYRTADDLQVFVDSWLVHRPTDSVLNIVNVAPLDADREVGHRALTRDDSITLFESMPNCGYARACNAAASYGDGDVIALFNADVVITEGALQECYEALVGEPTWGVLGPRQVDSQNRLTHAGIVGTEEKPRHRAWHVVDTGGYDDVLDDCPTVSGSAYFVKREVWDELTNCPKYRHVAPEASGAFLPTQHYYEETFCSYHARAHGYKVVYYGKASVIHEWHKASPVGGAADKLMHQSRDYFRFACDYHGIPHD